MWEANLSLLMELLWTIVGRVLWISVVRSSHWELLLWFNSIVFRAKNSGLPPPTPSPTKTRCVDKQLFQCKGLSPNLCVPTVCLSVPNGQVRVVSFGNDCASWNTPDGLLLFFILSKKTLSWKLVTQRRINSFTRAVFQIYWCLQKHMLWNQWATK